MIEASPRGRPRRPRQRCLMTPVPPPRLETLWAGDFGDAYVDRNLAEVRSVPVLAWDPRTLPDRLGARNRVRARREPAPPRPGDPPHDVWGADLNARALAAVPHVAPGTNAVWALARDLPFRDQLLRYGVHRRSSDPHAGRHPRSRHGRDGALLPPMGAVRRVPRRRDCRHQLPRSPGHALQA